MEVTIIGAGLAGSEAAWQLARRGHQVHLVEQRLIKKAPAHSTGLFAELVCSNSLRAAAVTNAVGLLKEEMRRQGSLIMYVADRHSLPAGGALAVDRVGFAREITDILLSQPNIMVEGKEARHIPSGTVIIAAGPLVSEALAEDIQRLTGSAYLHFHDAVAPVVTAESLNYDKLFRASRYGKSTSEAGDYLNAPMNKSEYERFYEALITAELVPLHDFEKECDFEGCMPIEAMAKRGRDTIRFGPLKPVGLPDPRTGEEPYAVLQLRQDDAAATLYNLVGMQTRLTWPQQRRVLALVPGLEQAEIVRYGVMHRNTYLNSPCLLNPNLSLKSAERIFFAGQITGVEGYVESAACGLAAGINAARFIAGQEPLIYPPTTAMGGLLRYIITPNNNFQPMNVTFGLIEPLAQHIRNKREKNTALARRALADLADFLVRMGEKEAAEAREEKQ